MFYVAFSIVSEPGNILLKICLTPMIYNMICPICHRLESKHWLAIKQDEIQVCIVLSVAIHFIIFLTDVC